jgi:hypothetical protein
MMAKINLKLEASPADKLLVKEFFYTLPMMERAQNIVPEMMWVLLECPEPERHVKVFPDYCYNIFDAFRRTYFKGFPLLSESVLITDPAGLASAKSLEQTKKVVRLDWRNLGRVVGIAGRCLRFAELESVDQLKEDIFGDLTPEKTEELFLVIFGRPWVVANLEMIKREPLEKVFTGMLNQYLAVWLAQLQAMQPKIDDLAYQWSAAAMEEFNQGLAEGCKAFMDVAGQLVGESGRSGIYCFLLFAWPEIKAMLESDPKKTMTDLHEWLKPFMRRGVITKIDIETLRDVCAPPPSGIGLSLRPLKSRPLPASA